MILKGHDNVQETVAENSHGGTGKYAVRTLLEEEFDSSLAYVRELILGPHASIGVHVHQDDEEIYYIASGRGVMIVDEEKRQVKPGDVVLTKSGSSHGLLNESDEDLKIFVACAKL